MFIKRFLSILLALVIFPATFVSATLPQEKINDFLDETEIFERNSVIKNNDVITRGEFCILVSNLINVGDISGLYTSSDFIDVTPQSEAFDAICFMKDMGILTGSGNGLFLPDNPITIQEAATILVRIIGYEVWVTNGDYISVAVRKGLLDGILDSSAQNISKDQVERMIFNTLEADVSDSNTWDGKTNGRSEESYMSNRFGIYKIKGLVSDDGITSLTGASDFEKGYIKIGSKVLKNKTGKDDLLGFSVTGYYKKDRENGNEVLLYVYSAEQNNKVLTIDAKDIISYKNNTFTYSIDNSKKLRTKQISKGFNLIYNGLSYMPDTVVSESEFARLMTPELGFVRIIQTSKGDEIVFVKSYRMVVAGSVDFLNKIITDKLPVKSVDEITGAEVEVYESFDFSNTEEFTITSNDKAIDFNSIMPDNVLSIALSFDGSVAEIILSTQSSEGIITSVKADSYTIGEESFDFSKRFSDYISLRQEKGKNTPKPGDKVTLYLNHIGEIAFYKAGSANGEFAYLDAVGYDKNGVNNEVSLKFITQGKEIKICTVAPKVKIDGRVLDNNEVIYNTLIGQDSQGNTGGIDARGKIIRINLNSDGKINFIDIPYYSEHGNPNASTEGEDSLHIVSELGEFEQRWYSYRAASFEGIISVDEDTVLFAVPNNTDDLKEILVTDFITSFKSNIWRYPTAYRLEKDSMVADAVVFSVGATGVDVNNRSFSDSCPPYLVREVTTAMNNDGELVTELILTQDGVDVSFLGTSENITTYTHSDGNTYEVTKGDIIQFGYNKFGYINDGNLRILYDEETDSHLFTFVTDETTNRINRKSVEIQSGWVNRITPTHMEIALKNPQTDSLTSDDKLIYSLAPVCVLVYDKGKKTIYNGSTADLIPFEYGGGSFSKIVLHNEAGKLKFVVIYK